VKDGKLLGELPELAEPVNVIAFSGDQSMLASGSINGTVQFWQLNGGKALRTLEGYGGLKLGMGLTFSQDGGLMATGSDDGTLRLWAVP